jgi:hypothetical protein
VALKACTVIVHDLNDNAHQLDVTAETLYKAVAQALAMVRDHNWVGDIGKGLTTVTVKVRYPDATHVVKIQDFENWLNRGCTSSARSTEGEVVSDARHRQQIDQTDINRKRGGVLMLKPWRQTDNTSNVLSGVARLSWFR